MITVRPARAGDFDRLAGEAPPYRVRAWTVESDGELLGIGGACLLPGGTPLVFIDMTEHAAGHALTLHRTTKRFLAELKADGFRRVVAEANPEKPAAGPWLERLGFVRIDVGLDGRSLYACDL